MTLIAILIAFLVLRARWFPVVLAERGWVDRYVGWWERRNVFERCHPALLYGALVLPPLVLLWWLGTVRGDGIFGLVDTLIAIILLVSLLSYRVLDQSIPPFLRRWRNQEWEAAYEYGAQVFDYSRIVSPAELLSQTITQYLLKSNRFLFAPLLWFTLFGSAGLALYLLTLVATHQGLHEQRQNRRVWRRIAHDFLQGLEGVSARLVAMSIALLSLNPKALAVSVRRFRVSDREAEIVLKLAVRMALDFKELPDQNESEALVSEGVARIHAVQDLRANLLLLWVLVIAFFTLAGWIL